MFYVDIAKPSSQRSADKHRCRGNHTRDEEYRTKSTFLYAIPRMKEERQPGTGNELATVSRQGLRVSTHIEASAEAKESNAKRMHRFITTMTLSLLISGSRARRPVFDFGVDASSLFSRGAVSPFPFLTRASSCFFSDSTLLLRHRASTSFTIPRPAYRKNMTRYDRI